MTKSNGISNEEKIRFLHQSISFLDERQENKLIQSLIVLIEREKKNRRKFSKQNLKYFFFLSLSMTKIFDTFLTNREFQSRIHTKMFELNVCHVLFPTLSNTK